MRREHGHSISLPKDNDKNKKCYKKDKNNQKSNIIVFNAPKTG